MTNNADLIRDINSKKRKAKTQKAKLPVALSDPKAEVDIARIRASAKRTKYHSDPSLSQKRRTMNALAWLIKTFPGKYVQMSVLYWLVYGGKSLKRANNPVLKKFTAAARGLQDAMSVEYDNCVLDICLGFVCPLTDPKMILRVRGPRHIKDNQRTARRTRRFLAGVGDIDNLDISKAERELFDPLLKSVPFMKRSVNNSEKLQLPAPETTS